MAELETLVDLTLGLGELGWGMAVRKRRGQWLSPGLAHLTLQLALRR